MMVNNIIKMIIVIIIECFDVKVLEMFLERKEREFVWFFDGMQINNSNNTLI